MAGIPEEFSGTFGCGHDGVVPLTNVPAAKRFARIEWLERAGKCRACFAKEGQKRLAKEAEAAAAWAAGSGLPELHGSVKQVPFGQQRRQDVIREAHQVLVAEGDWSEDDFVERVLDIAVLVTSAKWWIEAGELQDVRELPERLAESEPWRARLWEERVGAAPIVGSPKQIGWGQRARFQKVDEAQALGLSAEEFAARIEVPAARINAARWWIDIESAPVSVLAELLADAGHDAVFENVQEGSSW